MITLSDNSSYIINMKKQITSTFENLKNENITDEQRVGVFKVQNRKVF